MANTATRPRAKGRPQSWAPFDPFRTIFRLLTSVRFALLLLAAVAVAALLGVVFPQAPDAVRSTPASFDAYVQFQRSRYQIFTPLLRDLDLFTVFHSYWFNGLVIVLLFAVAVCTANRIPPIVRSVRWPTKRVNDRYFETAHHRASFSTPADAQQLVRALRRNHYAVTETRREGDAIYLFADKFSWTHYGTFISHLALILFLAGAVVTKVIGFSGEIVIPEGRTEPVFATIHAGQMQVESIHAAEDTNAQGMITRYHSELAVFKNGKQICRGVSTVNDPMYCNGYVFHQTNFSPYGVELRVKDVTSGQVVYDEVTDLGIAGRSPSPRLTVTDNAGHTLFDDFVVLAPRDPSLTTMYALLPLKTADGQTLPLLLVGEARGKSDWAFTLYHPRESDAPVGGFTLNVPVGSSASAGGLTFSIPTLNGLPLAAVQGIPGVNTAALLQQETDVHGQQYVDVLQMDSGQPGIGTDGSPPPGAPAAAGRLDLAPGQPQQLGNYQYEFVANRSITGITVRRDPGSDFIWVATTLLLVGLGITFYLPRRRMWVRMTPERTYMAGVADRIHDFSNEMRRIGAAAGSSDAAPELEDG